MEIMKMIMNMKIYNQNKNMKGERNINKNNGYLIVQNSNLINQLKTQKFISSYYFMINYNNKNEEKEEIIIGGLPHEYDPRLYSEIFYFLFMIIFILMKKILDGELDLKILNMMKLI